MASIDDNFIEEVKNKNDIVDLISSYVDLKKYHDTYKALCPFHSEKTPSFTVNERNQFFHCFGCGEGGDIITFIMKKENMDFMDALKYLADRANMTWPQNELSEEQKANLEKKTILIHLHTDVARFYFSKLWANRDHSLSYLNRRGLNNKIIKKFGLGYAPNDNTLLPFLIQKGYSQEILSESGLFVKQEGNLKNRLFSRIIFPIFDTRGRVIAFGGRVIKESHPKYLNSPETLIFQKKENLYGLNIAKNHSQSGIILVEGYMDVISLHEHGFLNAVASLGTAFSKEQAEKLKKYSKRIYIAYDSDEAGKKAALRAIDILRTQGISPYILDMGDSKDPDEFIKKNDPTAFQFLMDQSKTSLQFINDCIREKYDLSSDRQQIEFIQEITSILKQNQNAVEVEKEILRLSKITGISIKALGTEVYGTYFSPKQFQTVSETATKSAIQQEKIPIHSKDFNHIEMSVLYNMYHNSAVCEYLLSQLSIEDFSNTKTKEIFKKIEDKIENIDEFQGNNSLHELLPEEQLIPIVKLLQKTSIQNKVSQLKQEQENMDLSNPNNYKKLLEIGIEITLLNKKIKNL